MKSLITLIVLVVCSLLVSDAQAFGPRVRVASNRGFAAGAGFGGVNVNVGGFGARGFGVRGFGGHRFGPSVFIGGGYPVGVNSFGAFGVPVYSQSFGAFGAPVYGQSFGAQSFNTFGAGGCGCGGAVPGTAPAAFGTRAVYYSSF